MARGKRRPASQEPAPAPGGASLPTVSHRMLGTEAIDGLRGLAIVLVLAYHTWLLSWFSPVLQFAGQTVPVDAFYRCGYLGVDLFFVISGFCMFYPEARNLLEGAPALSWRQFAYRRFIKIVPSYVVALAVTALVVLPSLHGAQNLIGPLANHLFFFNNSYEDAFGQHNSVLWSLAVEVQFYLIFPLLALVFRRHPLLVSVAMVGAALTFRFATAGCCLLYEPVSRQLPAYLDLFACGMLAAYGFVWLRRRTSASAPGRLGFTLCALGASVAAFLLFQSANAVQYHHAGRQLWDLAGRTALAMAFGAMALTLPLSQCWLRRLVGNPVLVFLSVLSYNLYLWHTLVEIWLRNHDVVHSATSDPHNDPVWRPVFAALGIAASLVVAALLTYFIERPLLGTVRRQPFAFDWRRFIPRLSGVRAAPIARKDRRT